MKPYQPAFGIAAFIMPVLSVVAIIGSLVLSRCNQRSAILVTVPVPYEVASARSPEAVPVVEATEVKAAICDATAAPFFPCCDESNATTWTRYRPPPMEFQHNRLYLLSCSRTVFHDGKIGPAWVCGQREKQCRSAPDSAGECHDCTVWTAGPGKEAVWTGMLAGTFYGPYTPDGRRGIFPAQ